MHARWIISTCAAGVFQMGQGGGEGIVCQCPKFPITALTPSILRRKSWVTAQASPTIALIDRAERLLAAIQPSLRYGNPAQTYVMPAAMRTTCSIQTAEAIRQNEALGPTMGPTVQIVQH